MVDRPDTRLRDSLEHLPLTAPARGWVQMDERGILYTRFGLDGRITGQIVRTSIGWVCDGLRRGAPINVVFPYSGSGWFEAVDALDQEEGRSTGYYSHFRAAPEHPGWIDFGGTPPHFPRRLGRIIGDAYLMILEIAASSGPSNFVATFDNRPITDRRGHMLMFRTLAAAVEAAELEALI